MIFQFLPYAMIHAVSSQYYTHAVCTHQSRLANHYCCSEDSVYVIAQETGKTSELCEPNSPFRTAYENCLSCIKQKTNGGGSKRIPRLGPFLAFCHIEYSVTTGIFVLTDGSESTIVYMVPTGNSTSSTAMSSSTPSPTASSGAVETAVRASSGRFKLSLLPGLEDGS